MEQVGRQMGRWDYYRQGAPLYPHFQLVPSWWGWWGVHEQVKNRKVKVQMQDSGVSEEA